MFSFMENYITADEEDLDAFEQPIFGELSPYFGFAARFRPSVFLTLTEVPLRCLSGDGVLPAVSGWKDPAQRALI